MYFFLKLGFENKLFLIPKGIYIPGFLKIFKIKHSVLHVQN